MAAQYPPRRAAAIPIDTEVANAHNDMDERTYQYLEEVWSNALRRAQEAMDGQGDTNAPQCYPCNSAGPSTSFAHAQPDAATRSMPHVDATQLLPVSRAGERVMPSSPLPRAPPLQDHTRQVSAEPSSAPPSHQRQQYWQQQRHELQPVLRRPKTSNRNSWMKVEAQPNLKRNGYTSHKGVAWVVQ